MRVGPRRPVFALLTLALLGAAASAVAAGDGARDLYREGVRAYRAGRLDEAMSRFRSSEEADPTYPYPVFALARLYHELYDAEHLHYEEAAAHYARLALLLQANPPGEREKALHQAYYFQGLLCLSGGENDRALEALRRFLVVSPDFYNLEVVHNAVGVALYYRQSYDEAAEAFRRALAVKPDYVPAALNLRGVFRRLTAYHDALAAARAGDLDDALDRVQTLRLQAPGYLRGIQLEAGILRDLGRTDEALCSYREALAVDPSHPVTHDVRLEMAKLLGQRGQIEAAVGILNEDLRWFREDDQARTQTMKALLPLVERLKRAP